MSAALLLIAGLTLASAAIAMALRNLIHSALLLIASWAGIAAFYLWADAQFVAFAQVLVYVGAVSMIVLFAVLLTRRSRPDLAVAPEAIGRAVTGLIAGGAVLGILVGAVISQDFGIVQRSPRAVDVKFLGVALASRHAVALLIVGALLTVALLGAIVLAATERGRDSEDAA